MPRIEVIGLEEMPDVRPGDNLDELIIRACRKEDFVIQGGDVLVVAQKIISKAENRLIKASTVEPSGFALDLGESSNKDAKMVEVILGESKRIVRMAHDIIITQTKHGFVCANSGVDHSNLRKGFFSTLPLDPDKSAYRIRVGLKKRLNIDVAVVITDTFGRPWRLGQVDIAIGVSGLSPIIDYKGKRDQYGSPLTVTEMAVADELASAGELVKGKSSRVPVAIIRGYRYDKREGSAKELIREPAKDLFL